MAPDKELARLVVLDKVVGFGLPSQPVLARYCRTAAALFRTPIAFVSVVRTDQIQFLASQGLRTTSARRDPGLCSATIEQRGCRVIRDARGELRGAENSLVQGEPGIRFYAGTPLCHRGVAIGTLAVADSVPRTPGSHQVDTLLELTALLEAEIAENLQSAQGALDRMRSAKKEEVRAWLAYGLSHEYSNALTGAMALEETLTSISSNAASILERLHGTHSRMAELTRNFIAFHEGTPPSSPPLPLNELAESLTALMHYVLNEQIDIIVDWSRALDGVEVETRGLEFPLALMLVARRNAMEGKGGIVLETRLVHHAEEKQSEYIDLAPGDYATIAITTQGNPPTSRERAALTGSLDFDDNTPSQASSLWFAQEAVNTLGGQIDLAIGHDQTTTFTLFLPILTPVDRTRFRQSRARLLVVEDASLLVQALQSALTRAGYHVTITTRGEHALQIVQSAAAVDLLITDVLIPGMNGIELARRMRETRPDLPVVLMSGQTDRSHFEPGELAHVAAFLQKPFSMDVLLKAVERLLSPPGPAKGSETRA